MFSPVYSNSQIFDTADIHIYEASFSIEMITRNDVHKMKK